MKTSETHHCFIQLIYLPFFHAPLLPGVSVLDQLPGSGTTFVDRSNLDSSFRSLVALIRARQLSSFIRCVAWSLAHVRRATRS